MTPEVQRGAALLDEVRPGWEKEIDVDTLDAQDGSLCPLAQVFGAPYFIGMKWLDLGHEQVERFGFVSRSNNPSWIEAINERLNPLYVSAEFVKEGDLVGATS